MTTSDIRKKFLEFFKSKEHTIVTSDSLVPKNDPTVLFTTAGMQQFKRQFLGHIEGYTRAATSQKCMRTDDLDEVGKTNFHHTFFEMLGNFSFGDYFKKDAITWGWEFLTKELGIPEERLWVSINKDDTEAKNIWLKEIKIPENKLFELGDKSNFWPSNARENGPNGPCGPCSEIFYDYDPKDTTIPKDPDDILGRFSEIWNLVFTQYNRKEGGELEPLPNKNIDTGMGLERLAAVLQGKKNNFDIDIFQPILKAIDINIDNLSLENRRITADHMRGIVFGISDGVIPSNEGRGYVIKKLIIDITDKALQAGQTKPVIYKLVPAVVEAMQDQYPETTQKAKEIADIVQNIESAYIKVRNERLPEFKKQAKAATTADILGELIFRYRDTFGLAINTIEKSIVELKLDSSLVKDAWQTFEKLMKQQQDQSRAGSKMGGDVFTDADIDLNLPKTNFMGYDHAESTSMIIGLISDNKKVCQLNTGDIAKIVIDKTPFYAESGGQVGDTGTLTTKHGTFTIKDTQKIDEVYVHIGSVVEGTFKVGDQVKAEIDIDRRLSVMRNHTATHLMQAALREVLGSHIKQQGSYVSEDRLRFDFTHPKAITQEELEKIELLVNVFVRSCDAVTIDYLPIKEAQKSGALAFFAEKYGDVVRVISIGNYSKEFCGGSHLSATGQIGLFKISSESAIAQGIRRLEAKTGVGALQHISVQQQQLDQIADTLKSPTNELIERVQTQVKRIKTLEQTLEKIQFEQIKSTIDAIIEKSEVLGSTKIISHSFENTEMKTLRKVSDLIKQKSKSSVVVLGAKSNENASLLVSVTDDMIKKGIKANDVIKEIAPLINGSGGGRPQLAQAGSKETAKVKEALQKANDLIKEKVAS